MGESAILPWTPAICTPEIIAKVLNSSARDRSFPLGASREITRDDDNRNRNGALTTSYRYRDNFCWLEIAN